MRRPTRPTIGLLDNIAATPTAAVGRSLGPLLTASLDHAMWFHRPFRADDWLLYHQHSVSASSARGMASGSIFTRDGRLAVSVVQEGLIRLL